MGGAARTQDRGWAPRRIAGIVLAAGASTRMGSPKALLPLGERTYLEAVMRALAAGGCDPVVAVLGCDAERIRRGTDWGSARDVVNERWGDGMHSSLQAGLRHLVELEDAPGGTSFDAAIMALVDVPRFAATTVARMISTWSGQRAPLVVPTHDGRHGHPVLWARRVWDEVLRDDGANGPRGVLDRHRDELLEVRVDDPWVLRDADSPSDHRRLIDG